MEEKNECFTKKNTLLSTKNCQAFFEMIEI